MGCDKPRYNFTGNEDGTKKEVRNSICSTGFTTFGKHEVKQGGPLGPNTDIGYFGNGIYFTTSARYAADIYSRKDGSLFLSWVSMRALSCHC